MAYLSTNLIKQLFACCVVLNGKLQLCVHRQYAYINLHGKKHKTSLAYVSAEFMANTVNERRVETTFSHNSPVIVFTLPMNSFALNK